MIPTFYRERTLSEPEQQDPSVAEMSEGMRLVAKHPDQSSADLDPHISARFPFPGDLGDLLLEFLQQDADQAKLSVKFKIYYRLRPFIPIFMRQLMQRGRNKNLEVPEDWFLPSEFERRFRAVLEQAPDVQLPHLWPDGYRMSCVLTHDVETSEGVDLIPAVAEVEEELGFRSAWNFIPHKYPIDPCLLEDLRERGHEIGIHGFNHDGRLFESRDTFRNRTVPINDALRRFECVGFRTPMVHRNLLWMQALNVDYDCSCFDVDPFQAMPGGTGGAWPFFAGKFVELPYTLPQDHTLFVALGDESPRVWIEKFEWLRKRSGMAMLVTHPDYLNTDKRLNAYREFLTYVRDQRDDCWSCLPHEVSKWWRQRDGLEVVQQENTTQLVGSSAERASLTTLKTLFQDI